MNIEKGSTSLRIEICQRCPEFVELKVFSASVGVVCCKKRG